MKAQEKLLGIADLTARWVYTRQGVHKLIRSDAFPPPIATINGGRNKIWTHAHIAAYEKDRPELFDPDLKQRKTVGYFLSWEKNERRIKRPHK